MTMKYAYNEIVEFHDKVNQDGKLLYNIDSDRQITYSEFMN